MLRNIIVSLDLVIEQVLVQRQHVESQWDCDVKACCKRGQGPFVTPCAEPGRN